MDYTKLYNEQDKAILKVAEDSIDRSVDRVTEIINYCNEANIKKIGIANCIAVTKEADWVEDKLKESGFEVSKVNCRLGKIPFSDLIPDYKGTSCNPAGQATYLAENKTELNIMMGLCLGHDMIFNAKSEAPVTPLVVKDRKLKHKTIEILNEQKQ